jgi:hypothetical protein
MGNMDDAMEQNRHHITITEGSRSNPGHTKAWRKIPVPHGYLCWRLVAHRALNLGVLVKTGKDLDFEG